MNSGISQLQRLHFGISRKAAGIPVDGEGSRLRYKMRLERSFDWPQLPALFACSELLSILPFASAPVVKRSGSRAVPIATELPHPE
jgi:hypothetical protein